MRDFIEFKKPEKENEKMGTVNEVIKKSNEKLERKLKGDLKTYQRAWVQRHLDATKGKHAQSQETGILSMIHALAVYADAHQARFESPVGKDGILGNEGWLKIWHGVKTLLNGDLGRLDGGTLDQILGDMGWAAGFTDNELE